MRKYHASRRRHPDEPDPVNVRQWLVDGLLKELVLIPEDDGPWPPAILDGAPFPLAAAALGLLHELGEGPATHPAPHAYCSIAEQLRARRLASELHAELALEMERVDWRDGMLGDDYDED
jgi:hypothetical protein